MARNILPLNDAKIKRAKAKDKVYKLFDGGGLYLEIKPNCSKIWRIKYKFKNKEKTYTIGNYNTVSLKEAREELLKVKKLLKEDIDPVEKRRESKRDIELESAAVFNSIFEEFVKFKEAGLKESYINKQIGRANNYILPSFKDRDIRSIKKEEIIALVKNVKNIRTPTTKQTDKTETAKRVFNLLQQVYKFALHNGYIDIDTTAKIDISQILPKREEVRLKAITDTKEIRALYKTIIENWQGYSITQSALEFLALTALRPGNVINLKWEYVSLAKEIIIFPLNTTKNKKEFRLPLTNKLLRIIEGTNTNGYSDFVFPSPLTATRAMSNNTLNIAHKRLGFNNHNAHGWRSSFSTICYEKQKEHNFSYETIETQLMHSIGNKVTRVYMRSDFLEERRALLSWWGDFLSKGGQ